MLQMLFSYFQLMELMLHYFLEVRVHKFRRLTFSVICFLYRLIKKVPVHKYRRLTFCHIFLFYRLINWYSISPKIDQL
jgi:hypothetical protein